MGLLDQAAADLASILSDDVGGFAVQIRVDDPSGLTATIKGLAANIGFAIDPQTGTPVSGQKASVALPMAALCAAGLEQPRGVSEDDARPWLVTVTLPHGGEQTFKVASSMPDRLGCVVCMLEAWERPR